MRRIRRGGDRDRSLCLDVNPATIWTPIYRDTSSGSPHAAEQGATEGVL